MVASPKVTVALIGAQKCGTTTLASLVARHPSICLARNKEAHLFDRSDVQENGLTSHHIASSFPDYELGQHLFDATPSYLYLPGCVEALLRHSPDVKILVILRSPASRTISHFWHSQRLGFDDRSFLSALTFEQQRLRRDQDPLAPDSAHRHFSYLDRSRYAPQLLKLQALTKNTHVVLFSEMLAKPQRVLDDIFEFLDLPTIRINEIPQLNSYATRTPRHYNSIAQLLLRNDVVETEQLLALRPGSLR